MVVQNHDSSRDRSFAGDPTDRRVEELTILEEVGHPRVPEFNNDAYFHPKSEGDRTDVQNVTRPLELGLNVVSKQQLGVGKGFRGTTSRSSRRW